MTDLITIEQGIENIKALIEDAIRENGEAGKKTIITSSRLINNLHEVVKSELVSNGVNPELIHPPLEQSNGEAKLAGFLKFKKQDVCVFPNNIQEVPETLDFKGLHTSSQDFYGELFTEHILTINLRSQLSSLSKNIDTMYERTYAEPMNLHRRLPKMVLGEVYLVSLKELDSNAVKNSNIVYKPISNSTQNALEKYISGFSALNHRLNQRDDDFKYERVALVLTDFSQNPVKIYESVADLKADNFLSTESTVTMDRIGFTDFVTDLMRIYERRFGTGIFT